MICAIANSLASFHNPTLLMFNAELVDRLLAAILGVSTSPVTVFLFTLHTHNANEAWVVIRQDPCSGFEERSTLVYCALAASLAVAIVAQARVDWLLPFFTPIIPLLLSISHLLQTLVMQVKHLRRSSGLSHSSAAKELRAASVPHWTHWRPCMHCLNFRSFFRFLHLLSVKSTWGLFEPHAMQVLVFALKQALQILCITFSWVLALNIVAAHHSLQRAHLYGVPCSAILFTHASQ